MIFTSESVTEGHPDKVADLISDAILDVHMEQDPFARVACETLVKGGNVVLAGEITSAGQVDYDRVVRETIRSIGYTDPANVFNADSVRITSLLTQQAPEIAAGVIHATDDPTQQGAGDQGMMFGFACDDTPELMPLPIFLAHRLAERLAQDRHSGRVAWLRPDGKTQVTVEYQAMRPVRVLTVLVSAHHGDVSQQTVRDYVREQLVPSVLKSWWRDDIEIIVNPSGSFREGGPNVDCGLTGRKIIVDTYGGFARHGGGAFSGKDPTKVDRSGAYFCRYVARRIVSSGIARCAEVRVAYAIGRARPIGIDVETFGTGDAERAIELVRSFDFRPGEIIRQLRLRQPIYRRTTNYGHFGKPSLPWET
ncbi:methionine adenosyltransferase [Fontivita pretiosa]|uniref:methionine adenosyltransferase n=1 Tax=Fontivita pretiosa TaxID=2989684 RepID=UPI003D17500E